MGDPKEDCFGNSSGEAMRLAGMIVVTVCAKAPKAMPCAIAPVLEGSAQPYRAVKKTGISFGPKPPALLSHREQRLRLHAPALAQIPSSVNLCSMDILGVMAISAR